VMGVVREVASAAGGAEDLEKALAGMKMGFGVDIERDVLGSLGDEAALISIPGQFAANPLLAGLGDVALVIELRDPETFGRALDTLLTLASVALDEQGAGMLRETTFRGVRYRYASITMLGPVAPCVAICGDRLVFSVGLPAAKEVARLISENPEPLVEAAEFKSLLRRAGGEVGSSLSYGDLKQTVPATMGIVGMVAGLAGPAMGGRRAPRGRARRVRCSSNLKQIGYGCHLYSGDNNEKFPANLGTLFPMYIPDGNILVCPVSRSAIPITNADLPPGARDAAKALGPRNTDYVFVSGLTAMDPPTWIVAYDHPDCHGGEGVNVLYVGSNVQWEMDVKGVERRVAEQVAAAKARGRTVSVIRPAGPGAVAGQPGGGAGRIERPEPIEIGEFDDWVDLALLPSPRSYVKHLFPQVGTMKVDEEGMMVTDYGPLAAYGAPSLGGTTFSLGIGAGMLLPALASARERARRTKCMSILKQMGYGCHLYSADFNEKFPANLGTLFPMYVADGSLFICPTAMQATAITQVDLPAGAREATKVFGERHTDYAYVSGLSATGNADWVLAFDKAAGNHARSGRNVLHIGAHVTWLSEAEFQLRLASTLHEARAAGRTPKVVGGGDADDLAPAAEPVEEPGAIF